MLHHSDYNIIRHEFARVHIGFGILSELSFLFHVETKHITGRNMGDRILSFYTVRLRTFSGARRTQKNDPHFSIRLFWITVSKARRLCRRGVSESLRNGA